MGGLAIGSGLAGAFATRVRRPLRSYAKAEALVAVSGVAVVYLLPALTSIIVTLARAVDGHVWLGHAIRFAAAFGVLIVPAIAMGTTLPLLVDALSCGRDGFAVSLG